MTDLGESGGGEDAAGADIELSKQNVRRGHRIALDRTSAARPREVDGGARERTADPAAPEATCAGDEARHGPDAVVGLVLRSALPGDAVVAHETCERRARLDRAPADRLAVEIRHQAALVVSDSGFPQWV